MPVFSLIQAKSVNPNKLRDSQLVNLSIALYARNCKSQSEKEAKDADTH
jgi:hypothetical protein